MPNTVDIRWTLRFSDLCTWSAPSSRPGLSGRSRLRCPLLVHCESSQQQKPLAAAPASAGHGLHRVEGNAVEALVQGALIMSAPVCLLHQPPHPSGHTLLCNPFNFTV
jgi:hypothetical protein